MDRPFGLPWSAIRRTAILGFSAGGQNLRARCSPSSIWLLVLVEMVPLLEQSPPLTLSAMIVFMIPRSPLPELYTPPPWLALLPLSVLLRIVVV
jgi:hypothetical protein